MDSLPFVTPVYKRDLTIENYFIGYLKHPYISIYTGRGCKSRCTFCLWPQTVGGHRYRTRSVGHVIEEIAWAKKAFPQVKEFFFDDDTFTDNLPRAEEIARELGKLGVTWSCNAKANVPRETLKVLKDNGLRLLLVGYESGNQQILHNIKKGMRVEVAEKFTKDCHELGIVIHGTFIVGLPGETRETDPGDHGVGQADQSAHHPGLAGRALSGHLPLQAGGGERLARRRERRTGRRARHPDRAPALSASQPRPRSSSRVETFYKSFYFRPGQDRRPSSARWSAAPDMMKRRLREGVEFFSSSRTSSCKAAPAPAAKRRARAADWTSAAGSSSPPTISARRPEVNEAVGSPIARACSPPPA